MADVELALGPPEAKDENLWHYTDARSSYRTDSSYVPATIGIGFGKDGLVEMVLKGPVP